MLLSNAIVKPDFREQYQQQEAFSQPSSGASISGSFLKQLIEPEIALEKIAPLAGLHPHFSTLNDVYDAVQHVTETPGATLTQQIGNGIASLLGFALNPINIALGGTGGLLAKGAVKGVSALAPEFLSNLASKTITKLSTETVGSLGEKALTVSGIGTAPLIPQNLAESITPDNKVDISHFIKTTAIAGGIGLALGVVPFVGNLIRSKFFNRAETSDITEETLSQAEKNKMVTPEEKAWFQEYLKNPDNPELEQRAAELLQKNHPDIAVNPIDNKVNVSLLTPNDIKALQSVIPEELLAREGIDNPNVLSDFIQKNALDRLKQNPALSDGLKGILTELENKGEGDWKPFLSNVIHHIDAGSEYLADSNAVKDYLKQRIENKMPDAKLSEKQAFEAKDRLKQYEDNIKAGVKEESTPIELSSKHLDDSELAKEIQPTIKKYQEFKSKSQVFSDLMQCLQGSL
ncbi:hypothetical protein [Rickettsiella endosymbiont of Dermanyssus gallinae]|uniref:hypothetical protein n=1 Tax=Rickettsiella endosymbiont of Dermanyssus gallinae TaxID=2856608 RepID=UPI001C52CC81|nr:hypothetical protein [Rickettsiella endosymbiont of Dermanyssus gallinae]